MVINAVSAIDNVSSQAPTAAAASSDTPESERNLFMTLLVAQLKNQDPLSPQDGTAFVAQLAQFNSLDQLVGIRAAIDKLNTLLAQTQPPASLPAASETKIQEK
jgi:flagellar basal-body rod modification protein FlgD